MLKFDQDQRSISHHCPSTSMLHVVSFYPLFNNAVCVEMNSDNSDTSVIINRSCHILVHEFLCVNDALFIVTHSKANIFATYLYVIHGMILINGGADTI